MIPLRTGTVEASKRTLNRRVINLLFKVLVVVLPAAALIYELQGKHDLPDIAAQFAKQLSSANCWWLCCACMLIPPNWLAEVWKWRPFVQRHESMSLKSAVSAVLAGASFALFTPNRVGEYGGRLLYVSPAHHWQAFVANAVGSMAQYLVLLSGGIAGGAWFTAHALGWGSDLQAKVMAGALIGLGLCYGAYFNINLIVPMLGRLPLPGFLRPALRHLQAFKLFSRRDLLRVLFWSALRYGVYSAQYFMLLQFFGIKTGVFAGFAGIATIFLLQTVVPLPAFAGLLVRGNLAIFVWSFYSENTPGILAATFLLWIINLILPALIGTFLLSHVNITKTLGYEDE
ncbi:MAG: flippase-like domain-containing protein [Lewinellaceae bacterium]|nr:flippase-like domain-containing protein [Lewinellaceae bacterium]